MVPHDTCKSADNCISFCSLNPAPFSSSSSHSEFSIHYSNLSQIVFSLEMNDTTLRQTRTIPPPVENVFTDFTAFPADQMQQGKTVTESMATAAEWTNEKHSLYLKSMEATFVNQLYDSKHILGSSNSSGQFKVLRGGCWRNLNFQRENPWISRSNECHDLNANPWIQHFRSSSKHPSVTSSPAIEESDTSTIEVADLCQSRGNSLCKPHDFSHQDMLCDDTEMSDQNFIDEEVEAEKECKRSSNVKRLKSQEIDAAGGNDQMVPISMPSTSEDITKNYVSSA